MLGVVLRPVLAERHHVDVVVDEHGHREVVGEIRRDRDPVPSGQDQWADHAPGLDVHRPGNADADASYGVASVGGPGKQLVKAASDFGQHRIGPLAAVRLEDVFRQDLSRQIADGELCSARTHGGGEHDPSRRVELQPRGWPAAGGGTIGALHDKPLFEKLAHPQRDRGARHAGEARDVGPGGGLSAADKTKDLPGWSEGVSSHHESAAKHCRFDTSKTIHGIVFNLKDIRYSFVVHKSCLV